MKLTDLHDWEIMRVEVDNESKSAKLQLCYPVTNQSAVVTLDGIKQFHASGMRLQNVILDVLMFESNSSYDDLESSDYLDYCKKLLDLSASTFDTDTVIFYIEPSVGVEIACSCHSVDVKELHN